ncbi:MAG: T9SS type A sorting domain-containing protein [Bacteroidetes bacterium]|nr:T9SS type A sorting domain-containing protein [Bacteroidota bacterium]
MQYSGVNTNLKKITFIDSQTGWICGDSSVILKTTNAGGDYITFAQENHSAVTNNFSVSQNYPNPFNPLTRINYELSITNYVSIKVYDNLGNEVQTLVNEKQNAGSHSIDFNASLLPSGVYFYKLITENFSETKKMILVK